MSPRPKPLLESDWEAALPLYEMLLGRALTLEDLQQRQGRWPTEHRYAIRQAGQLVALIEGRSDSFRPPGYLQLNLAILPAARRQGHGSALLEALRRPGVTGLSANIEDDDPESLAWAQRRGFTVHAHRFESALRLPEFEPDAHPAPLPEGVSLGDMSQASEAEWTELLTLYIAALAETPDCRDLPGWTLAMASENIQTSAQARPDWIVTARRGGNLLGFTAALTGRSAYNQITAVAPGARGMGLAYALKVELLRRLKTEGVEQVYTHNHTENLPMQRVNQKLGYVRERGLWEVRRSHSPGVE